MVEGLNACQSLRLAADPKLLPGPWNSENTMNKAKYHGLIIRDLGVHVPR